jgi:excisionase family DNA binding protein
MTKLLSVEQAAELLGISPWTVRSYIRQGKLRAVRIGRRVLLEEAELARFVERSRAALNVEPLPTVAQAMEEIRNA